MFTYAEAEAILAGLHGADREQQVGAFRARLKHLKKLGIPLGMNPGRGKKVEYSREHLYQWAFCLECAEFGFDPSWTASTVEEFWPDRSGRISIYKHFFLWAEEIESTGKDDVLMCLFPGFMVEVWSPGFIDPDRKKMALLPNFRALLASTLPTHIGELMQINRRLSLLNLSEIVRLVLAAEHYLETEPAQTRGDGLPSFLLEALPQRPRAVLVDK
jgi:hypothetical protein